jgi:hypothetical protein
MTSLFQGKTVAEISHAMAQLANPKQTKAQFKALKSLDAETRDGVVNALEKDVLDLAAQFREYIDRTGAGFAKKMWTDTKAPDTAAAINEEKALAEIVRQVARLKGGAADPLFKAIAQQVSKLTKDQKEIENTVYGAMFDAIEKVMIANGIMPKAEENARLEKIEDAFGWRMSVAVKEHFNAAGKYQQFAAEPTADEIAAQKNALKGLLLKSDAEATLGTLKATDVFMGVARRVGSDADLAALLPKKDFDAADVDLLEKNKLPSLAALVKTAIQNKPK